MTGSGWFALSDRRSGGVVCARGLPAVLAAGCLVVEAQVPDARGGTLRLLDYRDSRGWARTLTLELSADGTVTLHQRQGTRAEAFALPGGLRGCPGEVRLSFSWDAPGRRCRLAAGQPDAGCWRRAEGRNPLPLMAEEAEAIACRSELAKAHPALTWHWPAPIPR